MSARLGRGDGAGGHLLFYVHFRNVSDSPCLLAGYPRVVATEPGRPDVTGTAGSFFDFGYAADMPPGGVTLLGLETDTYCAARPEGGGDGDVYDRVRIALPGGGAVSVTAPRSVELDLTCGLDVTRFFDPDYPQPEPVYPLAVLRADVELPSTARAGSLLHFAVDLRNPTGHAVRLAPCPGYVEAAAATAVTKRAYALNCAPVGAIEAHGSVRFAMRLPLPSDVPAGPNTIYWSLQSPGVSSTGTVLVDG